MNRTDEEQLRIDLEGRFKQYIKTLDLSELENLDEEIYYFDKTGENF